MRNGWRLIERYIWGAILPYLLLSALLLTAILLAQQTTKIAEILVNTRIPLRSLLDILVALLPNVLIFSIPPATLAGTVIGFSRMGSDSELIALRAAGVGTWRLVWPALLLGLVLSAGTLYLNLEVAPEAARVWKQATLRAALYKLDSPVEPKSFTTDIPGYVIYVRDGDKEQGRWGRVFLYSMSGDGRTKLVTARSGRIDTAAEHSELVLSDAVITTLPSGGAGEKEAYTTERLAQVRVLLETGRKALLERLRNEPNDLEGMEWSALPSYAATLHGAAQREALTLWHKRLTFGLAPMVFCLLGVAVGLRVRKGGRGIGIVLSLLLMVGYYLISLGGEQMARAGTVGAGLGTWMATMSAIIGSFIMLFAAPQIRLLRGRILSRDRSMDASDNVFDLSNSIITSSPKTHLHRLQSSQSIYRLSLTSLLDTSILRSLTLSFIAAIISLVTIFQIFTLFELWRFIAATATGANIVIRYLIFLLPFALIQLAPASMLIAILACYALMARRSEAIAWWASGQSIYRLMLPGLLFAIMIGGALWLVQEQLMPEANKKQDALRARIRSGVTRVTTPLGRQWLASTETGRIYSYNYDENTGALINPVIYQFDSEGVHLKQITSGSLGTWTSADKMEVKSAELLSLSEKQIIGEKAEKAELSQVQLPEVFKPGIDRPSQLSAGELSAYIRKIKGRGTDPAPLMVALQRKYAEPISPIVMALIGIPLALSFGRRSAIAALASAVGIGLVYWALTGGFQQLGGYSLLPPTIAAWASTFIFMASGIYLLSRART